MIRILLIGRNAASFSQEMEEALPGALDLDTARLPAAGIRHLDASPPDAVLVLEERPSRAASLISAIRERPIGELIPIVVLGPRDDEASEAVAEVEAWLGPDSDAGEIVARLGDALGMSPDEWLDEAPPSAAGEESPPADISDMETAETDRETAENDSPTFVLEEVTSDDDPGPTRLDRRNIFPRRETRIEESPLEESDIKRKLRAVRHEDYFAILEVGRGAETPTIRDAFHRLHGRYDPEQIDFELSHRYHAELSEIRDALEDAWAVLGDADLRGDYVDATTRK